MTEQEIALRLLQYLREALQRSSLTYAEGPTRITGGFETAVFGLKLNGAPESLSGPLVLRLFEESYPAERARLEAAVHNTLAELGYSAPRVFITGTDKEVLGGAFLVMERMPGHTLAAGFEGLGQGRRLGDLVRFLMRAVKTFREISRTMAEAQFRLHRLPAGPLTRAVAAEGLPVSAITFEGRLERLTFQTEQPGLAGLRPAAVWLSEHRPAEITLPSICHCDFQPFNILAEGGHVTGVLDWGNVTLASPEMDVGSTIAIMLTVPVQVPELLQGIFRVFINTVAGVYYRAYCRQRTLDDAAVRYHQVFRATGQLVRVAEGVLCGRANLGIYGSAAGVRRLISHIQSLTNLKISAPDDDNRG